MEFSIFVFCFLKHIIKILLHCIVQKCFHNQQRILILLLIKWQTISRKYYYLLTSKQRKWYNASALCNNCTKSILIPENHLSKTNKKR